MAQHPRYGITIPFDGVSLPEHKDWYHRLADLGYSDVWSAETDGADGFTPLALAAAWEPRLNLGIAVAPAYTRGPALLAQTVASIAEAAPGRFTFGLGSSSNVIVEKWNAVAFERPYYKVRDTLAFLKLALSGEKVDQDFDTFSVKGFKLARVPEIAPTVLLAALRPGMLKLAGSMADGAILNWLSAEDVRKAVAEVDTYSEIAARIFVVPSEDADFARMVGRRMITAYLNVPVYAEYHRWLGRGDALAGMWDAWAAGDRKQALAEIPDHVVDELIVHGSLQSCREHVQRYVDNGVTIPAIAVVNPFGTPEDLIGIVEGLAPQA